MIGEDFSKLFLSRWNDTSWTSRKSFCCAISKSAGSVVDPVLLLLQANLDIKRKMYTTTRRSFSYELYLYHLKVDAMLAPIAVIAVVSSFSSSDGTRSDLHLFFFISSRTSDDGWKRQYSVMRKTGPCSQCLSEKPCAESARVLASAGFSEVQA